MARPRRRLLGAALLVIAALGGCARAGPDPAAPSPDPPTTSAPTAAPTTPRPTPTVTRIPTPTPDPTPTATPTPTPDPTPTPTATPTTPTPTVSPTGPSNLPGSLTGAEWERIPTQEQVVALTFDAGANADGVAAILAELRRTGAPATFFLTGQWTERYPALAREIAAEYPVGNHTRTHPNLTSLDDARVRDEVRTAERIIVDTTGVSPLPLFRFPYGDRDARTIRLVNELGYGGFRWTTDTLGWQGASGGRSVDFVVNRVIGDARAGQIVLLHVGSHPSDGSTLDADALPRILQGLRDRGYRFVTLPEALRLPDVR